jgi:hypothetical protein
VSVHLCYFWATTCLFSGILGRYRCVTSVTQKVTLTTAKLRKRYLSQCSLFPVTDIMYDYEDAFKQLQNAIQTLPDSLLSGTRTGPIYLHLSPTKFENDSPIFPSLEALDVETEWECVNKLWECAFNKQPNQLDSQHRAAVVTCGHYGLTIALDFLAHFVPHLSDGDKSLLVPKISKLIELIGTQYVLIILLMCH